MITFGKNTDPPVGGINCYEGVDLTIGNFCSIASGLDILSGTHPCIEYPEAISTYPFKEQWQVDYPPSKMGGKVSIGNDVWIAKDVSILEGVTIGNGAIIGAKAVVTKDVPDYAFVAGNPARVKHLRFKPKEIQRLLEIKWWDWEEGEIRRAIPYMKNIAVFFKVCSPVYKI